MAICKTTYRFYSKSILDLKEFYGFILYTFGRSKREKRNLFVVMEEVLGWGREDIDAEESYLSYIDGRGIVSELTEGGLIHYFTVGFDDEYSPHDEAMNAILHSDNSCISNSVPFPNIHFVFKTEEPGGDLFQIYDPNKFFFREKWRVDYEDGHCYFDDDDSCRAYILEWVEKAAKEHDVEISEKKMRKAVPPYDLKALADTILGDDNPITLVSKFERV